MQVIFTPRAESQLGALCDYIASQSNENRADAYAARIVAFCLQLTMFPERGKRRDDLLPGLRTIGFERRVTVAFVISDDSVLIEGIFYGGQDFEAVFGGRE